MGVSSQSPSIGTYRDRDVPDWIEKDGIRFLYDRIALEDSDGTTPLAQLRSDEFVIAPGLIYRRAP